MTLPNRFTQTRSQPLLRIVALSMLMQLLAGCAYFNTYYNAQDFFEQGMIIVEKSGGRVGDGKSPPKAVDNFKRAITKAQQVINEFPDSKYIDDSYYILARSNYYIGEYGLAERFLNLALNDYPDHSRVPEVRIYLAKTHYEMGYSAEIAADLAPLISAGNTSDDILAQMHDLNGNIALENGRINEALKQFQEAALLAPSDAQKANLYYKLFTIMLDHEQLAEALEFHESYRRFIADSALKQEAVLRHVQLLQEMGEYERANNEVLAMIALAEFAEVVPGLQLELAKLALTRGEEEEYLFQLIAIKEQYPTLSASSDASYLLGEHYLMTARDLQVAKEYFVAVKKSTTFQLLAKSRADQITRITSLEKELAELLDTKKDGDSIDSSIGPDSALDGEDSRRFKKRAARAGKRLNEGAFSALDLADELPDDEETEEKPVPSPPQKKEVILDEAAKEERAANLLYRIGEIAYIDLSDTTKALTNMAKIYHSYETSTVTPKAIYFLYLLSADQSEEQQFWQTILFENFGETQFALLAGGLEGLLSLSGIDSLETLADLAVQNDPASALAIFETMRDRYRTEQSTFAIAYIYDRYVSDLNQAIAGYEEHLSLHPAGKYSTEARTRLAFLRDVKATATD